MNNIKAGEYKFSLRWRIIWEVNPFGIYRCYVKPKIGNSVLPSVATGDPSDMYNHLIGTWSVAQDFDQVNLSLEVMCDGDVDSVNFNFDDVTLTKVCDVNV